MLAATKSLDPVSGRQEDLWVCIYVHIDLLDKSEFSVKKGRRAKKSLWNAFRAEKKQSEQNGLRKYALGVLLYESN